MSLDLQQLRSFFMVVQAGGFSNAARRLHRTQSAVSHAVRKLEDSAGVRLIERRGREMCPTEEGLRLYQTCESIFAALEGAEEELERGRGRVRGRLRLGATVEFGNSVLMRHIQPFVAANPDIELDFRLSSDLLTPLLREDIDLAIDCVKHKLPELERTPLFREAYMVACSPSYLAAHQIHDPEDLSACTVLTMDKECEWWGRFLMALPKARRPVFGRTAAVNHIRGMINAAVSDIGVLLAPSYSVQSELGRRELVPLFPGIRPLEDRFALYQKVAKADLLKHRLLKQYLKSLRLSEFGA
jgi:DNA-binding transcriptional LysR family regulator